MPEQNTEPAEGSEQEQTFTQAEVDRIVGDRLKRERDAVKAKYGDYDDLKAKAEGAKTVEQQLADMRAENAKMQRDTLAARIAAQHGIAPEDADLFLTGSDADTLTAQAKRLAERDQARPAGTVPNEGRTPTKTPGSPWRGVLAQMDAQKSS